MGAFLVIAHPTLYEAGCKALRNIAANPTEVQEGEAVLDILQLWASPFSAYAFSSNRASPFHRDNYSRPQWYEMLATFGPYTGGRLVFANIGVEVQYDSGTMVALSGKLLRHGVPTCSGNRVCIAQYMRDNVHARMSVKAAGWMTTELYDILSM